MNETEAENGGSGPTPGEQERVEQREQGTRKTANIDVAPPAPRVDDLTPSTGEDGSKVTRRQE